MHWGLVGSVGVLWPMGYRRHWGAPGGVGAMGPSGGVLAVGRELGAQGLDSIRGHWGLLGVLAVLGCIGGRQGV